ncbi:zinc ribbon domain-containing protein [Patescibacteria group bacterium]|nr:zinc ribbon domain-containing protein [Patescibacteria group bacterium]
MDVILNSCPFCGTEAPPGAEFCPHCGKKLKTEKPSTSVSKQVLIYLVSFLLPPLGLVWTFKYLKQDDIKSKRIGWISIILTLAGIVITIFVMNDILSGLNNYLNSQLNSTIQLY